jgi:DNA-binding GntR family transcriptional regulator
MSLIIPAVINASSSRDYAYQVLLTNIIQWNLLPGEPLRDSDISQALNISRTPVREAIYALRDDNLVSVGYVTRVALIDPKIFYEGLYIRTAIETLIADDVCGCLTIEQQGILRENLERQRLIVEGNIGKKSFYELDNEFHGLFYRFADKEFSYSVVTRACHQLNRMRNRSFQQQETDLKGVYELHCAMYEAAVSGDYETLRRLNRKHCFETTIYYHSNNTLIKEHPEYFTDVSEMERIREKMMRILELES